MHIIKCCNFGVSEKQSEPKVAATTTWRPFRLENQIKSDSGDDAGAVFSPSAESVEWSYKKTKQKRNV